MSTSKTAALTPVVAALIGLCAAASSTGAMAGRGTSTCPGSSLLAASQMQAEMQTANAATLSEELLPGISVATPGTSLALSPQLQGKVLLDVITPFVVDTPDGKVKGEVEQKVIDADNHTCDCYWRIKLHADSAPMVRVKRLRITSFNHPANGLFADFRNDLVPGGWGSFEASRSGGAGTAITFKFDPGIGPGEVSRPVFLDTQIDTVAAAGKVRLFTDNGRKSAPLDTYVPAD
jgi:hypothetical protein